MTLVACPTYKKLISSPQDSRSMDTFTGANSFNILDIHTPLLNLISNILEIMHLQWLLLFVQRIENMFSLGVTLTCPECLLRIFQLARSSFERQSVCMCGTFNFNLHTATSTLTFITFDGLCVYVMNRSLFLPPLSYFRATCLQTIHLLIGCVKIEIDTSSFCLIFFIHRIMHFSRCAYWFRYSETIQNSVRT